MVEPSEPVQVVAEISSPAVPDEAAKPTTLRELAPDTYTGPRTDLTTGPTYTAVQIDPGVPVYSLPDRSASRLDLAPATDAGIAFYWSDEFRPQHLATADTGDFYELDLPLRPNSLRGYVAKTDVRTVEIAAAIFVDVDNRTLRYVRNGQTQFTVSAAVGRSSAPTPRTTTYVSQLYATEGSALGPFALSLAAFSDVLTDFGGGVGQSAIHGTTNPSSIGQAASAGCVRLSNSHITEIAATIQLGTPVFLL